MKLRLVCSLLAVLGMVSMAAAQDYAGNHNGAAASVDQTITITIPTRLALHVPETTYSLNLNGTLTPYSGGTYPGSSWAAGEGCAMLRKGTVIGPSTPLWSLQSTVLAQNIGATSYPAVQLDSDGNVAEDADGYVKGSLVCFNQKVVQKFANVPWVFNAKVVMDSDSSIGKFGMVDNTPGGPSTGDSFGDVDGFAESDLRYLISPTSTEQTLKLAYNPSNGTRGWLDDQVMEVFWFDGTETPGTHLITVTYTLSPHP